MWLFGVNFGKFIKNYSQTPKNFSYRVIIEIKTGGTVAKSSDRDK